MHHTHIYIYICTQVAENCRRTATAGAVSGCDVANSRQDSSSNTYLDSMKDSNTYLDSMAMLGLCLQYGGRYAEAQQVSFDTVVGLF